MINTFHIINSLDKGGAEMMLYKLLKNSNEKFFNNLVICLKENGSLSEDFKKYNIKVVYIKIDNFFDLLKCFNIINKLIKTHNPYIVISWLHISDLIGALIKIKFPEVKLIWNLRCSAPKVNILGIRSWALVKFLSYISTVPDCIIANSKFGLDGHIAMGYKPKKKKIIYNGFDTKIFKPSDKKNKVFRRNFKIRDDDFVIGFIGKKSKIKGLDLFVDSMGLINKKFNNLKFVFLGYGLDKDNYNLKNKLKKNNCLDNSILLGESKYLENIIPGFNLLSITSLSEGFPNVLGEAMSIEVPCVVNNVGDCKFVMGGYGIVVDSFDPLKIVNAWETVYKMPLEKKIIMGQNGRDRIKKMFSIKKIVYDYEVLMMDIYNG